MVGWLVGCGLDDPPIHPSIHPSTNLRGRVIALGPRHQLIPRAGRVNGRLVEVHMVPDACVGAGVDGMGGGRVRGGAEAGKGKPCLCRSEGNFEGAG